MLNLPIKEPQILKEIENQIHNIYLSNSPMIGGGRGSISLNMRVLNSFFILKKEGKEILQLRVRKVLTEFLLYALRSHGRLKHKKYIERTKQLDEKWTASWVSKTDYSVFKPKNQWRKERSSSYEKLRPHNFDFSKIKQNRDIPPSEKNKIILHQRFDAEKVKLSFF